MKQLVALLVAMWGMTAQAQLQSATLQASGLTCSMCSKAVKTALDAVPFVEKVQVDIKNQEYKLTFRKDAAVELDALNKAVQEAGFSVASLKVTADIGGASLEKDKHLTIGGQTFHFLNAKGQTPDTSIQFSVVDKGYVTTKEFKKYAAMTTMACVQTGRAESCCAKEGAPAAARVYHVIL